MRSGRFLLSLFLLAVASCGRLKTPAVALSDGGGGPEVAATVDAPAVELAPEAPPAPSGCGLVPGLPAGDAGAGAGADGGADAGAGGMLAFPGAEGFGRFSRGGRGGAVCHVTTLADSGPGSLRACVTGANRTVVFDVGGWITLATNLNIAAQNLTLAGQTAPGGGIGVRGRRVTIAAPNIQVRFMRFRRGTITSATAEDTLDVASYASNVIVDHCSVGFGIDETFSMPGDEPTGPRNLTVQWTIIGYSLQATNHSAGSLLVGNDTTIHHTLWALNKTRNPRGRTAPGAVLDWVNNVTYGWDARHPHGEAQGWSLSHHPFIMANTPNGVHQMNAVGNVFVSIGAAPYAFVDGMATAGVPAFNLYFAGNLLDGNGNGVFDVSKNDWSMVEQPATQLGGRLPAPEVATDPPETAYDRVLSRVGAIVPARDEVDRLLVSHVRAQTGELITTEADLMAAGVGDRGYGTLNPGTPPEDSDCDGMPDGWEMGRLLDPRNPADHALDPDGDGYTNLEDYLNTLAAGAP